MGQGDFLLLLFLLIEIEILIRFRGRLLDCRLGGWFGRRGRFIVVFLGHIISTYFGFSISL